MSNPIAAFLEAQGTLIVDGGLATELELRGNDLDDALWSARLLLEDPASIRDLHLDYLKAGADCIISASYQATIPGLMHRGMSREQAVELLVGSVQLALEARELFWAETKNRADQLRPLVAASVGPYGAYLANGAEYTGAYDLDGAGLREFHRARWHILANAGADLLAVETLPSYPELLELISLHQETPGLWAWFSFSCRDGRHISDGTPLVRCLAALNKAEWVAAVGANCTAPNLVPELIATIRTASALPIIVYPNSGEQYDAAHRRWRGEREAADFGAAGRGWQQAGASLIGGCCRTGPDHILQLKSQLVVAAGENAIV